MTAKLTAAASLRGPGRSQGPPGTSRARRCGRTPRRVGSRLSHRGSSRVLWALPPAGTSTSWPSITGRLWDTSSALIPQGVGHLAKPTPNLRRATDIQSRHSCTVRHGSSSSKRGWSTTSMTPPRLRIYGKNTRTFFAGVIPEGEDDANREESHDTETGNTPRSS